MMYGYPTRKALREFAKGTTYTKVDLGKDAPKGKRWAIYVCGEFRGKKIS